MTEQQADTWARQVHEMQAPPWKPEHLEAYFSIDGHHVIMCAHCRCVFGQDVEPEK
jgi:hypothetical protein